VLAKQARTSVRATSLNSNASRQGERVENEIAGLEERITALRKDQRGRQQAGIRSLVELQAEIDRLQTEIDIRFSTLEDSVQVQAWSQGSEVAGSVTHRSGYCRTAASIIPLSLDHEVSPLTSDRRTTTYVASAHSQVLLDCGIGIRRLAAQLEAHVFDWHAIDAVFISHMHIDHISGLATLLKHVPARVYAHQGLGPELALHLRREMAGAKRARYRDFEMATYNGTDGFCHRDLDVLPVRVSHDSEPTVMYKLCGGGRSAGVLTDLGTADRWVLAAFADCDALLLEANHCPRMLASGPYPLALKRRISGDRGHLSNQQAVEFATGLARLPRHLLLGHLSDINNTPRAASDAFTRVETGRVPHTVIPQQTCGPLLEL
jgi:phosphoribosyl 1,2-cyclic phosphodiesterase